MSPRGHSNRESGFVDEGQATSRAIEQEGGGRLEKSRTEPERLWDGEVE
ncbi:MAG: hypothetical protein IMF16_02265 [Proteobacteria bacterium]|nr:hypothetical protein [Pseudomonadota bacterium]